MGTLVLGDLQAPVLVFLALLLILLSPADSRELLRDQHKETEMQITYSTVLNPRWENAAHTRIYCEVNFDHLPEELVPFSAVAEGDYPHTHEIFARCVAGDFGPIADYTPPDSAQLAAFARIFRDRRLAESDWTQLPDVPQAIKSLWATYRQELRDITQQAGFPQNITWPTKPQ
jgi:hypothetical protein